MKKIVCCILFILTSAQVDCATLVYNMKIRRAFAIGALAQKTQKRAVRWLLTALPIWYQRNRTIRGPNIPQTVHAQETLAGSLCNIRLLAPHHWWAEVTTGIERQSSHYTYSDGFHTSRTGLDDVVLTVGKNWFFNHDNGQIALYGLTGIPTKWNVTLCDRFDPPVGTRLWSVGIGGEISYSFRRTIAESLVGLLQTRFVHFFNRTWAPIIPCEGHLQPGNITDLVMLVQYRKFKHVIEVGYNPTFFTHQAAVLPTTTVATDTFVRNAVFANYLHLIPDIPGIHLPGALGAGFTISRSKQFDTKIGGAWLNVSILI